MNLYSAFIYLALKYGPCVIKGSQFYLPPTNEPYLPLLCSGRASPPFGGYSLHLPTKGWPGWVDLGRWSHTEINVPHPELNPDTVTHHSTNRARRRLTSLIDTNALPLLQTTTVCPDFWHLATHQQKAKASCRNHVIFATKSRFCPFHPKMKRCVNMRNLN